jgi:hypothetical protein
MVTARAGGSRKSALVPVHVALHMLIAFFVFGTLYSIYVSQDLHRTDCFAWYSKIASSWSRTGVQKTYCNILQGTVETISSTVNSIVKPPSIHHLIANVFGVLLSTIVGAKTTHQVYKVYNATILKLTCALIGQDYALSYGGEVEAAQAELRDMVVDMIKNLPAVATPAAAVRSFPMGALASAMKPKATKASKPAATASKAVSKAKAASASASDDEDFLAELAEEEKRQNGNSSSEATSGATSNSGATSGSRPAPRRSSRR